MMKNSIRAYLSSIGKKGGKSRSKTKKLAAQKNGSLGGRPKIYREPTAFDAMQAVEKGEDWKVAFFNFVDGFRRNPSGNLIEKSPLNCSSDLKKRALLQSICIELCLEHEIPIKGWLCKKVFLSDPWFVSGIKNLYAMALKESPLAFRKNNIFVLENFLIRV